MEIVTPELLAARRARFDQWRRDARADVEEFAGTLGVDPPQQLAERPIESLPKVEAMLRDEDLSELSDEAARWLAARLLVFVGQVLAAEHAGDWMVDDDPHSPSYGRYVIGTGDAERRFDPAAIVRAYLADPPPRSLVRRLAEAESG